MTRVGFRLYNELRSETRISETGLEAQQQSGGPRNGAGEAPQHVDTVDSVGDQLKIAKPKFTEVGKL